jgi:hypothetical protein
MAERNSPARKRLAGAHRISETYLKEKGRERERERKKERKREEAKN